MSIMDGPWTQRPWDYLTPRNDWYNQCTLRRGNEYQVTFIPTKVARKGSKIRIKEWGSDDWSENWVVEAVGPKISGEIVESNADEWRHHRTRTDV